MGDNPFLIYDFIQQFLSPSRWTIVEKYSSHYSIQCLSTLESVNYTSLIKSHKQTLLYTVLCC